ncbi:hypothetical protein [Saccharomonospora piscinae]|uniref:hypothetical protein n=1 Tax=Saccharomonospora piscinae TaxID=687388 RepID=UPI00315ACB71
MPKYDTVSSPQRLANPIHVARRVGGGHVRQQRRRLRRSAFLGDRGHPLGLVGDIGRIPREQGNVGRVLRQCQIACHRRAVRHPARVDADDVVLVQHRLRHAEVIAQDGRKFETRTPRSAGVGEQHSSALVRVGTRQPRHGDLDRFPTGIAIVQWNVEHRALQTGSRDVYRALTPAQRARWCGGRRSHHWRQRCHHGGGDKREDGFAHGFLPDHNGRMS